MTELYGAAVHCYYGHDYMMSEQLLSQVAESGSLDPRVHYFLGLTREMQGSDGTADFEKGARLEAEGRLVVNVGQALVRIQGSVRGKIEKARRMARVQVRAEQLADAALRKNSIPKADPNLQPAAPEIKDDPFGEGMTSPDKKPAAEAAAPATKPADASSDPFGDDPEPAAGDPFGTDAGTTPAADPFAPSGDAGAADPFAPAGDAPADPFAPAGGDDPFNF
jgi:hypothetical protein